MEKSRDLRKALKIESQRDKIKFSPLRYQNVVEIPLADEGINNIGYVAIQDQKVSEIYSIDSSNQ